MQRRRPELVAQTRRNHPGPAGMLDGIPTRADSRQSSLIPETNASIKSIAVACHQVGIAPVSRTFQIYLTLCLLSNFAQIASRPVVFDVPVAEFLARGLVGGGNEQKWVGGWGRGMDTHGCRTAADLRVGSRQSAVGREMDTHGCRTAADGAVGERGGQRAAQSSRCGSRRLGRARRRRWHCSPAYRYATRFSL
jgi:hypothetical protein